MTLYKNNQCHWKFHGILLSGKNIIKQHVQPYPNCIYTDMCVIKVTYVHIHSGHLWKMGLWMMLLMLNAFFCPIFLTYS